MLDIKNIKENSMIVSKNEDVFTNLIKQLRESSNLCILDIDYFVAKRLDYVRYNVDLERSKTHEQFYQLVNNKMISLYSELSPNIMDNGKDSVVFVRLPKMVDGIYEMVMKTIDSRARQNRDCVQYIVALCEDKPEMDTFKYISVEPQPKREYTKTFKQCIEMVYETQNIVFVNESGNLFSIDKHGELYIYNGHEENVNVAYRDTGWSQTEMTREIVLDMYYPHKVIVELHNDKRCLNPRNKTISDFCITPKITFIYFDDGCWFLMVNSNVIITYDKDAIKHLLTKFKFVDNDIMEIIQHDSE